MAAGSSPPTFLLLGAAGGGKSLLVRRLRPKRGGASGAGRAPGHTAHGGHQPDGPATAAEGDCAGAGRLHGPHLAQLLQRVQRSPGEQRWELRPGHGPEERGCRGWSRSVCPLGFAPWWDFPPPCTALAQPGPRFLLAHLHPTFPSSLQFVVDASNPAQVSSSCIQLLSVLSAAPLASVPVLVLFNKIDLPCYMSLVEMKSLFRMQDIVSSATQPITMLETSARDGTGLADVLQWLRATLKDHC